MLSIQPHSQQKKKSRNRKRKGLFDKGRQYNLTPISQPVRAPRMPREFSVSLKTTFLSTGTSLTTTVNVPYPVVEFYGYNPQYMAQLYGLYRYCKITAIGVRHTVVNTAAVPLEFSIGVIPATEITGLTTRNLSETPGGKFKLVGPNTGTCKAVLSATYSSEKYLGNVDQTSLYWITATQAANTVAVDPLEPWSVVSVNGTTIPFSYVLESEIVYHCQFFDLRQNQL